jgi:hypothetical protein
MPTVRTKWSTVQRDERVFVAPTRKKRQDTDRPLRVRLRSLSLGSSVKGTHSRYQLVAGPHYRRAMPVDFEKPHSEYRYAQHVLSILRRPIHPGPKPAFRRA